MFFFWFELEKYCIDWNSLTYKLDCALVTSAVLYMPMQTKSRVSASKLWSDNACVAGRQPCTTKVRIPVTSRRAHFVGRSLSKWRFVCILIR